MIKKRIEITGDNYISSSIETPLLPNAFEESNNQKIEK